MKTVQIEQQRVFHAFWWWGGINEQLVWTLLTISVPSGGFQQILRALLLCWHVKVQYGWKQILRSLSQNLPFFDSTTVDSNTGWCLFTTRHSVRPDFSDLFHIVLSSTYFLYGQQFYNKLDGLAMGSPLSRCSLLFNGAIWPCSPGTSPSHFFTYVDDTFLIWPHGKKKLEEFQVSWVIYIPTSSLPWKLVTRFKENPHLRIFVDMLPTVITWHIRVLCQC